MKKHILMATLAMTLAPALALAAPDFNGSWVRDKAKSDQAPNTMYWTTRSGPSNFGGGRGTPEVVITVHQDAKELKFSDSQSMNRQYILDGKPHSAPTATGIQKEEVTASLQGDNLVVDTVEPFGGMPGNVTLNVKEVWSLSPDGKTLTITTTRDVPARQQVYKQVYNRTQAQSGALCSAGCVVPQ